MVLTSAKKPINIVTSYHVISLFFHLILILSLHCQLFLLISGYYTTCNIKITYQCKIIIIPEEGWFGQPKYSTHTKKRSFYVVSTSAFIFFILYVKPIRSLLHDPTYTSGIIVPVACLNVLNLLFSLVEGMSLGEK